MIKGISGKRPVRSLVAVLAVAGTLALGGCGGGRSLRTPIRSVGGTEYFTAEGRAERTASFDFTKKLAWLSAASELARSRASEVHTRLTLQQQARVRELLRGRDRITGIVDFVDELTARAPLRDVYELGLEEDGGLLVVTLGIPMDTWRELVDEAAMEVERELEEGVIRLEPRSRRPSR